MKLLKIFDALIYQSERYTDLEGIYNDETNEDFTWQEVREMRATLAKISIMFD